MRSGNKRLLVGLTCGIFMLVLLFSSIYIVQAADHVCADECCMVCRVIARVEQMLHGLVFLIAAVLALRNAAAGEGCRAAEDKGVALSFPTLVNWKIRLND